MVQQVVVRLPSGDARVVDVRTGARAEDVLRALQVCQRTALENWRHVWLPKLMSMSYI
jgi:hypothetical protein